MIQSTQVWEMCMHNTTMTLEVRSALAKAHGSKRSGTIYIVADSAGEAEEVVRQLFTMHGYNIPIRISVCRTHLVHKALRIIY